MTPPSGEPLDALLAQAGWARTLARHLVRDTDAADDLVQRAWVAALEHPPASAIPPRRWLAAVMRNLAREMRRGDARRSQRENASAKPERVDPDSPIEQIETQKRLLAAIQSLGEPYRATVWARYYEGLSPREIAAREGVPVKTVATRLHRALHELRARLDREHGGRRGAWIALLVPLTEPRLAPAMPIGALLVDAKLKIAGAIALAAGLLSVAFVAFDGGIDPAPTEPTRDAVVQLERPIDPVVEPPIVGRSAAERPASPPDLAAVASIATADKATSVIRGRVVDLDERPVANLRISTADVMAMRSQPTIEPVLADGEGRFELPRNASGGVVQAASPTWVTVYGGYVFGAGYELVVHVAPRRELAGVVVDALGSPVESARVELVLDPAQKRAEGRRLDGTYPMPFVATTGANGRFELLDAPLCAAELVATSPGSGAARVEAPVAPKLDLRLVLANPAGPHAIVRGTVVDADRRPVGDAWVILGKTTRRTAKDGRFEFDLGEPKDDGPLVEFAPGAFEPKYTDRAIKAVRAGSMPAEVELPPFDELVARPEPIDVEVVLASASLAIEGDVRDADGKPVGGALIRTLGESRFGSVVEKVGADELDHEMTAEQLARGANAKPVASAADGSFRVEGLLDREYRLQVVDPATLRRATTAPIRAGARDAHVTLASGIELAHVAGRVVSLAGEPISDVLLFAGFAAGKNEAPTFHARRVTDAEGRFDFGSLQSDRLTVQVTGPGVATQFAWTPPAGAKLDELRLEAARRCMVQVDLGTRRELADEFAILDDGGRPVPILRYAGNTMWNEQREKIVDGRSESIATDERARTLVLWKGGRDVGRIPVALEAARLTIVRP